MHRIFERGPRAASPAEFPSLVPSAVVGHASIYLGLRGPAFAVADLATSGESAFAQATQLVAAGEAACVVGGAVEPRSDIVDRVLAALFAQAPSQAAAAHSDVAAAFVVEDEAAAAARGARVLARVRQRLEWRTDASAFAAIEAPRGAAPEVILARPHEEASRLLAGSPWAPAPRLVCAPVVGESDGLGGLAIAIAAARVAAGHASEVLVLGLGRARGHAIVLAR
jgi:3-oxoacyl-[acyl-carrier-protein] synthase II